MKVASVESFIVGNPPPSFGGKYFIFVKVTTACGISGIGEVYSPAFHPTAVTAMIEDVADRVLIGSDPFLIEQFTRTLYGRGFSLRPDPTMSSIQSGLEIALWDIKGKALDQPVHQLLGGRVRDRVRAYTYLYPEPSDYQACRIYEDPDMAAERALHYLSMGFTGIKFDPAGGYTRHDPRQLSLVELNRSEQFVIKLRAAVGDKADLLFGTHGQMTPAGAARLAKRLEASDPLWFEEPVPPDRPEEMAQIARKTSIPIATGERLVSKYEFARVLELRAAAILQPALGRVGGLWEAKKIAAMAEAFHVQMAPHLYCGPVEGAANVHFAATLPNFLILESIEDWGGFHAKILKKPMKFDQGYVEVPMAPGLGIELDEDVARANPYLGQQLHLDMHPITD
ncbi:MAG: mandelate racemase/muconate lactonizing enzyme family protein [Alphaproteobacteria bacterium]